MSVREYTTGTRDFSGEMMEKLNIIKQKKVGYIYTILKAVCFAVVNVLLYRILNIWGAINIFKIDFLPYVTITGVMVIFGLLLIISFICSHKEQYYIRLNLIIKHYKNALYITFFILGILAWQRCEECFMLQISLFVEELFVVIFVEVENNRILPYSFNGKHYPRVFYTERPVCERSVLTKSQENALIQMLKILDERSSLESVNIALIGAWGKGKTSVMDTLISELQNRNNGEPAYFILKINTQTIQGISNILDYVRGYIYALFKQYGIVNFTGKTSVAFITALIDMLGNVETKPIINALENQKKLDFSDLECEKKVFSYNIQKLLKRSQKKNIVFVIDDAERSEHKKQILKLLSEFISVNGILSIISLDDHYDKMIRPISQKIEHQSVENENQYNVSCEALDKYIHVRVRIEELNRIEYETSIRYQLIDASRHVRKSEKGLYYIDCIPETDSYSLFTTINDHGTNRIESVGGTVISGEHNLLMELFHYNLEKLEDGKSLGDYLNHLIENYFYHSKEFQCLMNGIDAFSIRSSWFGILDKEDIFDWSIQIEGIVERYFFAIGTMLESLDILERGSEALRGNLRSLDDYYKMCIKKQLGVSLDIDNIENNVVYGLNDGIFIGIKKLIFSNDDLEKVENMLIAEDYAAFQRLLINKLNKVVDLLGLTRVLADFMRYFRDTLNNYRLFKMQLREAELLDMYYLEYLTKDWIPREKVQFDTKQLLEKLQWCKGINVNWPSLRAFLNTVLYKEYITNYGVRFTDGTFQECKAWILYDNDTKILVVTAKDNGNTVHFEFTTEGQPIEVTEEGKRKIENIIAQYIEKG